MNPIARSLAVSILLVMASAGVSNAYRPVPIVIEIRSASSEPAVISGWCDVEIGHRSLNRIDVSGKIGEIAPIKIYARRVDRCEVGRDAGTGDFTLVITEDDREVFRQTTGKGETVLRYGPTKERHSTLRPVAQ